MLIKYILCIPVIVLTCVVCPIYIFFNLIKAKLNGDMNHPETLRKFAFFYYAYKPEIFFYEIINFIKKITFMIIQVEHSKALINNDSSNIF